KGAAKRRLWDEFLRALGRVREPKGAVFDRLVTQARALLCPNWAREYKLGVQLLVKLCFVLEEHAGGQPWALSVRLVMTAVDTSRGDAHRMLKRLENEGVIRLVERGMPGTLSRKASTWVLQKGNRYD